MATVTNVRIWSTHLLFTNMTMYSHTLVCFLVSVLCFQLSLSSVVALPTVGVDELTDVCNPNSWVHQGSSITAYRFVTIGSVQVCCQECNSDAKCDFFTYNNAEENKTNSCHLKSGTAVGSLNSCSTCITSVGPTTPPPTPPPQAPAVGAPNILLLFPDQWRYDWDGYTRDNQPGIPGPLLHVPTTHAVAARGTRFTTAYVPAAVCAPSRSCLASGREYDAAGVPSNGYDYPINQTTFYAVMRSHGYYTMTTGKDDLTKRSQLGSNNGYPGCPECKPGDGLYHQKELGFSDALRYSGKMDVVDKPNPHEMYGFFLQNKTVEISPGNNISGWEAHVACMRKNASICLNATFTEQLYEDDYTAANAIRLLQRKPAGVPWFLHVSFPGPHDPFLVTADMRNAASDGRVWPSAADDPTNGTPGGACSRVLNPSNNRTRCNYAAEIENLDSLFAKVLAEVERLGEMNNTIVCVASDHGEMLGDHGDVDKSKPWEGSAHVPLMCAGPGILQNKTVSTPVATMDMAGTFMDYASAIPAPGMTTRSFKPLLEGRSGPGVYREFVSSGLNNFRLVVQEIGGKQFKYICCQGPCPNAPSTAPVPSTKGGFVEMLIDIIADPYDMHDLAPTTRDVVNQMRPLLPPVYASGCMK